MITTYRARRRQKISAGVFREPNDLLPELHLARTTVSQIASGYAYETQVEPEKFLAELRELNLPAETYGRVLDEVGLADHADAEDAPRSSEADEEPEPQRRQPLLDGKPADSRVPGLPDLAPPPPSARKPRRSAKKAAAKAPSEKVIRREGVGGPAIPQRSLDV